MYRIQICDSADAQRVSALIASTRGRLQYDGEHHALVTDHRPTAVQASMSVGVIKAVEQGR